MTHSPEPWTKRRESNTYSISSNSETGEPISETEEWNVWVDGNGERIADDQPYECSPLSEFDMGRAMACVNACKGHPTDLLNHPDAVVLVLPRQEIAKIDEDYRKLAKAPLSKPTTFYTVCDGCSQDTWCVYQKGSYRCEDCRKDGEE